MDTDNVTQNVVKQLPLKSWVYITFIKKNLFVHVYNEVDFKKVAVKFLTLSTFMQKSNLKPKIDPSRVELFADFVAEWLKKWNAQQLIVVFRGTGIKVDIRSNDPANDADRKRILFINALEINEVVVTSLIDLSPVPFNGCKTPRKRRGRDDVRRITV